MTLHYGPVSWTTTVEAASRDEAVMRAVVARGEIKTRLFNVWGRSLDFGKGFDRTGATVVEEEGRASFCCYTHSGTRERRNA